MLFFKKNQVKNQIKTNSKNLKTQTIKSSNEDFLDNRLYEFSKKIKKLSKGNRQKIQFIVSILHNPDFIILDEPFSGLDPVSATELEQAILQLKENGKTIVYIRVRNRGTSR